MPLPFVKRLGSIIRNLPMSSTPMQDLQPPPASHLRNSSGQGVHGNSHAPSQSSGNGQGNQQPSGSSSANAFQFTPPGLKAKIVDTNIPSHRVIFMVKHGTDYKLAQICVSGVSCHDFFSTLSRKYFHLRGFLRSWFSVWRYSHCDFYRASTWGFYPSSLANSIEPG
jgi:hypothetical protein